ncbi:Glycerol-3-phosphate acyltransferase 5 [Platanthera zijinensis]|uniref:Glycerol-3-phosphate acyltransferase 5 n=1 Tax=Platanthera zijinensis TaxID=2320716 RepID=A0AAP0BRF3_9ASPA
MPVAIEARASVFHGTTARGWKGFDSFYFFMNPSPVYEVSFLSKLPAEWTCGGGERKSYEVANYVQRMIAGRLLYECTNLTRKDKYRALAGNEGVVAEKDVKNQGGGGGVCWSAIWGKVRTRAWFYIKTGCWFGC